MSSDCSALPLTSVLARGLRKRCPHCGDGPIFRGWSATTLDACPVCGLVYERNAGDTWLFTIFGDRIPVAVAIATVYFGLGRIAPLVGNIALALAVVAIVATAPNRWGAGIALHYLSRRYWPDASDPIPADVRD